MEAAGPCLWDAEDGTLMGSCIDRVLLHLNCEVREARARVIKEKNLCHGLSSHHISYRELQHCLFPGLSLSLLRSHSTWLYCSVHSPEDHFLPCEKTRGKERGHKDGSKISKA